MILRQQAFYKSPTLHCADLGGDLVQCERCAGDAVLVEIGGVERGQERANRRGKISVEARAPRYHPYLGIFEIRHE